MLVLLLVVANVVSAAALQSGASVPRAQPADMHNSRNSLDWAGTYEGVLACADCPRRHYDDEGLVVGTPGEWKPLTVNIEGFTHREGVRNVRRVKRFQGPAFAGGAPSNQLQFTRFHRLCWFGSCLTHDLEGCTIATIRPPN